uniref:Uncharacterized protein n=1 Tax=Uncultured archaeon GZfos26G2 TaxID=3386331 RepID=Q64C12_UNCAG|nr:hypothetical protein GZ26D6_41 [uncultured archaeon GZfos26D6]
MSVTVRLSLSLRRASNGIGSCFWRPLIWSVIYVFSLHKTFTVFFLCLSPRSYIYVPPTTCFVALPRFYPKVQGS